MLRYLSLAPVLLLAAPVSAQQQQTEFQRAVARAPQDARDAQNKSSQRTQQEAAANRAGLDHQGRLPITGRTSVGGTVVPGGATVNVRTDGPN